MQLSREEQETIIKGNAASQTWEVVTADPRIIPANGEAGLHARRTRKPVGIRFVHRAV